MKNNKVVYAWYADNLPFYIGIGSVQRSKKLSGRNLHCLNKRAKAERENCFEIRILHKNLSWGQACELEQSYISLYGRRDLGTGILTNLTDGGEGHQNPSKETREKISSSKRGRVLSKETKKKLSLAKRGNRQPHTERTKRKMIVSNPRSKAVMTPEGKFDSCRMAARFIKCSTTTITNRIKSNKFSGYYFV